MWVMVVGTVLFGVGFGALDTALNAHAARHFGARDINWMHASYGLGATLGPLVVTALLSAGRSWRQTYGVMALVLAALSGVLALARRGWRAPARAPARDPESPPVRPASAAGALAFTAVETGIESGAGIWGYLFLTGGRGLPAAAAGVAVSAYWAMMCAGRVVLGPVAERLGPSRVLAVAVAGVPLGAALMAVPGPGALAVAGLMLLGLAAAPVFPLFTLATRTTRMVSCRSRPRPSAAPRSRPAWACSSASPARWSWPRRCSPSAWPRSACTRSSGQADHRHPGSGETVHRGQSPPHVPERDHLSDQQAGAQGAVRDQPHHVRVVAGGHAVRAVDLQLARDDQVHGYRCGPARQQPDLDVPAAAAQAAHRAGRGGR